MNAKTSRVAALFACLLVAPGCYSVDDPAMPELDGSTGEDPSTSGSADPTGDPDTPAGSAPWVS